MIVATADEASSGGSKQGRITKRLGWKGNGKWKNGGRKGGITKEGL